MNGYTREGEKEYKSYRNRLNNIIKLTKNQYYKGKLYTARGNCKKTWEIINDIAGRSTTNKINLNNINIKNINGEPILNKQNYPNIFNNYFTNIGTEMSKKIKKTENLPKQFLGDATQRNWMYLKPITQNELIDIISKLKTNSSSGPDGISSKLIKNIHPFILSPLAHIINMIFKNGKLPHQWKESIITPVYKSGKRDSVGNYRPISIINNFAKIFEHSLKSRLTNYLNDKRVLTDRQFGFISGSNTENAVLDFMKEIIGLGQIGKVFSSFPRSGEGV